MARQCTVCSHLRRAEIDHAIAAGQSFRDIARQFGLDKMAVSRHRAQVADRVAQVRQVAEATLRTQAVNVVADLELALGLAKNGIPPPTRAATCAATRPCWAAWWRS